MQRKVCSSTIQTIRLTKTNQGQNSGHLIEQKYKPPEDENNVDQKHDKTGKNDNTLKEAAQHDQHAGVKRSLTSPYARYAAPDARIWGLYLEEAEADDRELMEPWNKNLDSLLVFVSHCLYLRNSFLSPLGWFIRRYSSRILDRKPQRTLGGSSGPPTEGYSHHPTKYFRNSRFKTVRTGSRFRKHQLFLVHQSHSHTQQRTRWCTRQRLDR